MIGFIFVGSIECLFCWQYATSWLCVKHQLTGSMKTMFILLSVWRHCLFCWKYAYIFILLVWRQCLFCCQYEDNVYFVVSMKTMFILLEVWRQCLLEVWRHAMFVSLEVWRQCLFCWWNEEVGIRGSELVTSVNYIKKFRKKNGQHWLFFRDYLREIFEDFTS